MDKLYHSIGEVAAMLGVRPSALRYYEERFPELRPGKNSRGERRYTEHDIELLRRIVDLSRQGSYTLDGVRTQLRGRNRPEASEVAAKTLRQVRAELVEIGRKLASED
ncbi:MAG: MerR family transcriptional regulator [Bacteroidales bacterium]|nr:MerR family transcriptional regulator [Bacteroidales bacterium]